MAGPLGLSLAGQANDRYGSLGSLYPPTSTGYGFPGLGPPGLLGHGMPSSMSSMGMLPPSLMPSSGSGGGKRSPPPSASTSLPSSAPPPPSLASMGRTHMGLMGPVGLGLGPYPLPSPSTMHNPVGTAHHLTTNHQLPIGPTRPSLESTPPAGSSAIASRSLIDLTSPHAPQPPGLTPFGVNPLDPYLNNPRKDDPQSR